MNFKNKSALSYIENVLGVRSLLESKEKQSSSKRCKYIFFVENYSCMNEEAHVLLQKMIQAMKMAPNSWTIEDLKSLSVKSELQTQETKTLILKMNPENAMESYSPEKLLVDPDLKKKTWEYLKSFL